MSISQTCIERPVMTMMIVASIIVFGVISYISLPVNDLPATDYPVISVTVGYPGASPETMASNVATPLERQFMQISGLELITSRSSQGNTQFTLQFNLNKSIDAAATDVQAAITRASGQLPADLPSQPTYTKTNPNDQPIVYLALVSNTQTTGQLYDYANTQIGQRISIMDGVSQVQVYGQKSATRIKVDPSKLAIHGLTFDDFVTAVQSGTVNQGAGQFDDTTRTFLLDPQGQLMDASQYETLIIAQKNGGILRLRDVATAHDSLQDERFNFSIWMRGINPPSAGVVIAVFKAAGSNAVAVSASIKELLKELKEETPPSMQLYLLYDRSNTIISSVHDVEETLIIAFVLVVIVIYVFLGRLTDTIIPAVALPLSLLLTFIPMYALGYSLDNLSLMALTLSIGFLVDDAIVFLENTVRRMEGGEDAMTASINGAQEIMFTIVSMTLSLAAVFIPLVFMAGLVGRIFREFSITIVISILASGFVSITVTPLMCSRMLHSRGKHDKKTWLEAHFNNIIGKIIKSYGNSLGFFLHHRWVSAVTWTVCMVGTCYLYTLVPKTFLPTGDSGFIHGVFIAPDGSSPDQMKAYQQQVDAVIQQNPNVQQTITLTNLSGMLPSSFGMAMAFLNDSSAKPKRPSIAEVTQQLNGALFSVPGIFPAMRPQPTLDISTGATSNNQGQYAYTISGVNPDEVYDMAQKMLAKIRPMPEISSVSSDMQYAPKLKINILRDQASRYGVTAQGIEAVLRNACAQNYVYLVKKSTDQYEVIVEADDKYRRRPDDLGLLYVNSTAGTPVPVSAVATWSETMGPQAVNHVNQFVSASIYFDLSPDAAIGTVTDKITKMGEELTPPGVLAKLQGQADLFTQMVDGMTSMLFFAIFVMYVILGVLYENYLHPVTVLSALPVASIGGLMTLLLFNQELSLYGFIGMFMLMGIVKKNGIMMIDFALQRMDEGLKRTDAVKEACVERFRPIIMTSLAALMGAVPLAMGWGNDGSSRQPLGLIIVGGLIVSQLITLYVTPALFLYMEQIQDDVLDKVPFLRSSRHRKHAPAPTEHDGEPALAAVSATTAAPEVTPSPAVPPAPKPLPPPPPA